MIKYKGSPINFPPLEHPVVLIITDNVVEAKKELQLAWDLEDSSDVGQAVFQHSTGIVYCIVLDTATRLNCAARSSTLYKLYIFCYKR